MVAALQTTHDANLTTLVALRRGKPKDCAVIFLLARLTGVWNMPEKLTLAQMADSWVYGELARKAFYIEQLVSNINSYVPREESEKYDELKAEALKRLSS